MADMIDIMFDKLYRYDRIAEPCGVCIPVGKGKYEYVHTQREFFNVIMKRFVKDTTVKFKKKELVKLAVMLSQ